MRRSGSSLVTLIVIGVVILVAAVVLGTWILQWVWAWVVPDVFAGLVKADLLPTTLTFWQAFKLSLLTTVLVGASRSSGSSSK